MGRLFCGKEYSDIYVIIAGCFAQGLWMKQFVIKYLLPGSRTANPQQLELKILTLVLKKKKIAIGLIWRKFDLVLYSDFCLSSGRVFCLKYFSYDLCPNISVIMILVWIFVFTVFLVQATLLFTKMVTKSLLHLKMKENGSTQLREIRGPLGNVDEDRVFGILHHVKR